MDEAYQKAREKITRLCSRQEKCSSEILSKLASWGLTGDQQESLLSFLKENKYVDDQRYAYAFVRQHYRLRSWGKRKIKHALIRKKIPESYIQLAFQEIDDGEYLETLIRELRKKRAVIKPKNRLDMLARLQRFALSKGYEPEIIRKALDDVAEYL